MTEDSATLKVAGGKLLTGATDPDAGDVVSLRSVGGSTKPGTLQGTYGSLIWQADGSYAYTLDNEREATNALAAGQTATDTFNFTIADKAGATDTKALAILVTGANDAPKGNNAAVTLTENSAVAGTSSGNLLLGTSDPDIGDTRSVTGIDLIKAPGYYNVKYGTLAWAADGSYTYALDNNRAVTNSLAAGQTVQEVFKVAVSDRLGATTTQTLTINVQGANDAPMALTQLGSVTEDSTTLKVAGGKLLTGATDPDAGDVMSLRSVGGSTTPGTLQGIYGSLTWEADGSYAYTLDNAREATNALAAGRAAADTFNFTIADKAGATDTKPLAIVVFGANDGPTGGDVRAIVMENSGATGAARGNLLASASDPDAGDVLSVTGIEFMKKPGQYSTITDQIATLRLGTFTWAADGTYSYTLNERLADALAAGQTVQEELRVTISDGKGGTATELLTINIQGANDAPVAAGLPVVIREDGDQHTRTGTLLLGAVDPDFGAMLRVASVGGSTTPGTLQGVHGTLTWANDGTYSYTLGTDRSAIISLAAGEVSTDIFSYVIMDEAGATGSNVLAVTVIAQNDAATIEGTVTGTVTEDGNVTASGTLTVTDPDRGEAAFTAPASLDGAYGRFSFDVSTGAWGYTLNNAAANVQALKAGQIITETLNVASLDGTASQDIVVRVSGAEDAPVQPRTPLSLATLARPQGVEFAGLAAGDSAGYSVASTGDVNGDGIADFFIGAPLDDTNGELAGAGYVVFGRADAQYPELSDIAAGSGGFRVLGESGWNVSSAYVAGAGDVNGDGLADILVSAHANDAIGPDCGAAYVVFGKADGATVDLNAVASGNGGFKIVGQAEWDRAGLGLSSAGDLNQDGYADLLIAAQYNDAIQQVYVPPYFYSDYYYDWWSGEYIYYEYWFGDYYYPEFVQDVGAAYVVYGKADGLTVYLWDVANGSGGYKISGEARPDVAGSSVAQIGDMNGDGIGELLIGARQVSTSAFEAGATYVVFGRAGGTEIKLADVAAGIGGFKILGENASDNSGYAVSAAGDVNHDGIPDLIIGAPNHDLSGAAYVVYGKAGTAAINLTDVTAGIGGFRILGENLNDLAGYSVAGAGDINHDGFADVLVGAPDEGTSGAVYLVFGKADGIEIKLADVANGYGGLKITGSNDGARAGISVSALPDLNGDQIAEILIGQEHADPSGRTDAGSAWIVYSQSDWLI